MKLFGAYGSRGRGKLSVLLCLALLCPYFSGCALFRPKHKEGAAISLKSGKVTVEFSGVSAFPESDLRGALADSISTIKSSGLSPATADDAAFFLQLYYRKDGYAEAEVAYEILGQDTLRLNVTEGPRAILGDITFTGNAHAASETLRDYVIGTTRGRLPSGTKQYPYFDADIQQGVDLITRYYLAQGFLDAKVSAPEVAFTNDKTRANLSIAIVEGRRYTFGAVTLAGPLVYPEGQLRALIADQIPLSYTQPRVDSMARTLEEFYRKHGYYKAQVTPESDPNSADAEGRVPARFVVKTGALYYFDGVTVHDPNGRLKPQYLVNRFRKLRGKVYSPDKLDKIYQEMVQTGLFSLLRIDAVPQKDNTLRLDMEVEEAKARQVGFSLGYDTFDGPIVGVELRDLDFRGTGRPLSFTADYSSRTLSGELLYQDPHFLETDFQWRESLDAITRDLNSYTKNEIGLMTEFTRPITRKFRVSAFFVTRRDSLNSLNVDVDNAGTTNYTVNALGGSALLDLRDSPILPTHGLIVSGSADVADTAFGSSIDFVRTTFRMSYLQPIFRTKMTLALGFRAGLVQPFGNTVTAYEGDTRYFPGGPGSAAATNKMIMPIDERFFNGGGNTVRSFYERSMGPFDARTGQAIGGEAYTISNAELQFPVLPSAPDLRGAVFFDAGNLRPYASQIGFADERYAIGAGIRYNLPIGPLRIDYGVNPDRRPHESEGAAFVSFGLSF